MAAVASVTASMLSSSSDYKYGADVNLEPKMETKVSRGHSPTANKQHVHYELWPDSQGDIKVSHTTSMKPEQRYLKNNQKVQSEYTQLPGSESVWLSSSGSQIANATSVAVAPVARSLSNRSQAAQFGHNSIKFNTMHSGGQFTETATQITHKKKKLGHRRVKVDGEITYKKIQTTQLIGSIQLGVHHAVGSLANVPQRDLLMQDFMTIDTVYFGKSGSQQTPAHNYSDFRFRTYASFAFRTFRKLFSIETDLFLASICSDPMIELSNPGASGSIFYVTSDDNFVCKTVQHKEAEFLKILLAGYYLNLQQNQRTLLPKFFGLYCYSCNTKNVRIVVMNNLLPSALKMHHKFDLKGSTYKRKATRREKAKVSPTFKDLDFMEMYPDGIALTSEIYSNLMNSIQRDCRVLESFKIMDYSLLIGIHNIDQATKERDQMLDNVLSSGDSGVGDTTTGGQSASGASDCESGSTEKCAERSHHFPMFERQSSFIHRERMIAHSTALESITINVDSESSHPGADDQIPYGIHQEAPDVDAIRYSNSSTLKDQPVQTLPSGEEAKSPKVTSKPKDHLCGLGVDNVWGGIPAKNHRGENLLLFIGIIDILQSYGMLKKVEHYWKSLVHDGDTVSVHRPAFFASRFQNFMKDKVFKKPTLHTPKPLGTENVPSMSYYGNTSGQRSMSNAGARPGPSSHRKSQHRRPLLSNTGTNSGGPYDVTSATERTDSDIVAPPVRGGTSKEKGVTVITINSTPSDNVFLPQVLQDRKPRMHSGSQVSNFNEPEISFNTLNQGRNVKSSTSSNNSSGDSSERKVDNIMKRASIENNKFNDHISSSNSGGDDVDVETTTHKVSQNTHTSTGESQNTTTGKLNSTPPVDESGSIGTGTGVVGVGSNNPETGSIITMTSDERVQIFVPSPSGGGTPYSTITKASEGMGNVASQGGTSVLGNEFRGLSPRPPSMSKSWESTNQGPNANLKNTLGAGTLSGTSAYSSDNLQPSSSDGLSDESNTIALSSSVERSPPPFAKRVFAGTDIYRSLTPLNMDCHSSDEGAFNAPVKEDDSDIDSNQPATSVSVFRTSPPRGPLATLVKGNNSETSNETSLDMIKICLKDPSEEYPTTSVLIDNSDESKNDSNNKTALTPITSESTSHKSKKRDRENADDRNARDIIIQYDNSTPSDNETTSMDRTIVDSELPSLPIDKLENTEKRANNESRNDESFLSAEQNDIETEPISLSDIKLEENSQ